MSEKEKAGKSAQAALEEAMLALWEKEKTFEKSLAAREGQPRFSFNDGPPFANGLPHFGHSLVTAIKDSTLRYKTMRGYYVPRRNGWDCHGLPVEYDVEKQLGISGKKQILDFGLEKFNQTCRDSIFRYKADWETFLKRFGRWSDYQHYYATVDSTYTESVWWTLSEINKKGLLYKGLKSVPYCPRCETPLSNFELNEGYKDNVPDPSVFVLFPLKDKPGVSLLAWTTTPWTLPANAGLAVKADADYALVQLKSDDSRLILAEDRLDLLELRQSDYSLLESVKGTELVGLAYQPLYELNKSKFSPEQVAMAHKVWADDNVSLEDGTGILHVAPRYGEVDLSLGLQKNLPLIESVDSSGHLILGPKQALGKFFKEADTDIIADLTPKGRIFAAEMAEHTYPFCWRCDTPLMYFATSTWFVAVTKVKQDLLKTAEEINWTPSHIKDGRFGKWLEGARDWAISRNRYWGAPMPIWVNQDDEDDYIVISSLAELQELAGQKLDLPELEDQALPDLHRPYIDEVVIRKDGKTYKRVEEVLDCWFESGSMPYAQWHYPFENKEAFKASFPADFVTEGLDQTRLWFYVQHVISTILFDRPAYKNVIVNGFFLAADGQKLSKRLRNYPPTQDVFNREGADAWRLYMLASPQATERADYLRFRRDAVTDVQRNILATLQNSFKFFKTYAELDGWQPKNMSPLPSDNILDKWILARLDETVAASTKSADNFKIAHAVEPIFSLVDDLSNWYIRRSRRRYWKSENDQDKQAAYATLHCVLMRISQLLAPWAPFISDHLWRELTKGMELPESVHLSDWPSVKEPDIASLKMLEEMKKARVIITEGLSQRAAAKIKVRQPLPTVKAYGVADFSPDLVQIIQEELNVKEVKLVPKSPLIKPNQSFKEIVEDRQGTWPLLDLRVELGTNITPELKAEGISRDLIRSVQNARKNAGFNVADRIKLRLESPQNGITEAAASFKDTIFTETLTTGELAPEEKAEHSEKVQLEGSEVSISISRA